MYCIFAGPTVLESTVPICLQAIHQMVALVRIYRHKKGHEAEFAITLVLGLKIASNLIHIEYRLLPEEHIQTVLLLFPLSLQ
jgi:hypothetical protein